MLAVNAELAVAEVGERLIARLEGRGHAAPESAAGAAVDPLQWLDSRLGQLPPNQALPIAEHLFGASPLIRQLLPSGGVGAEVSEAVLQGRGLAALGLFTPNPQFDWTDAAVGAEDGRGGLLLQGEVRIATAAAEATVVLVRVSGGETRLALLAHEATGVTQRLHRRGGQPRLGHPSWLILQGVEVPLDLVSDPLEPKAMASPLHRILESYAGTYARLACGYVNAGICALRRAARTTAHRGTPFNSTQEVTLAVTELEIEADLLALAVKAFPGSAPEPAGSPVAAVAAASTGFALAASASRLLSAVGHLTGQLRDTAGLEPEGPFGGDGGDPPFREVVLGGAPMMETALARSLGL